MAIDFSAGLLGYQQGMQKQEDAKQKMFNTMFPDTATRKANTQEDWVNSIYKMPGDMFQIKDGKLTGIDGWSGMPTKEAAWNDYVAMSEENRIKPNRLFFEQHYTNAKASFDKELSDKLEGLKASGQFKEKDIQNAVAGLNLHSNYYANPAIAAFMPQKKGFGWLDIAAAGTLPASLGYSLTKGFAEGGPTGALKAAKKNPMLRFGTTATDWAANKFLGGKIAKSYEGFENKKDIFKVKNTQASKDALKDIFGKTKTKAGKNIKNSSAILKKLIKDKGAKGFVADMFKKYGYTKATTMLASIFGKGALSVLLKPTYATGIGAAADVALLGLTAKQIIDIAKDMGFNESLVKEGAKY